MKLHTEEQRACFRQRRADEMRRHPTEAELRLRKYLEPLGFQFQVSIEIPRLRKEGVVDGYILDCFQPGAKLCVEVDGGSHAKRKGADGRRDRRLAVAGIRTVRVSNREVLGKGLDGALGRIVTALNETTGNVGAGVW